MSLLGKGGLATVVRISDELALKVLSDVRAAEEEAAILDTLGQNSTVVGFYGRLGEECGTGSQSAALLLELCQGSVGDLLSRLSGERLPNASGLPTQQYIAMMINCVAQLHSRGVIHQDIKPNNFLFGRDGSVKLCDFNLSRLASDLTRPASSGTLLYFSPQKFSNIDDGYAGDWWALGVTFYQLLHGFRTWPFSSRSLRRLAKLPPEEQLMRVRKAVLEGDVKLRPSSLRLPRAARTMIQGLLHPQPEHRWGLLQLLAGDYPSNQAFSAVALRYPRLASDMERLLAVRRLCRSSSPPWQPVAWTLGSSASNTSGSSSSNGRPVDALRLKDQSRPGSTCRSFRALSSCLLHPREKAHYQDIKNTNDNFDGISDRGIRSQGMTCLPLSAVLPPPCKRLPRALGDLCRAEQLPGSVPRASYYAAQAQAADRPTVPSQLSHPFCGPGGPGLPTGLRPAATERTGEVQLPQAPAEAPLASVPRLSVQQDSHGCTEPLGDGLFESRGRRWGRCISSVLARASAARKALVPPRSDADVRAAAAAVEAAPLPPLLTADGRLVAVPFVPCEIRSHRADVAAVVCHALKQVSSSCNGPATPVRGEECEDSEPQGEGPPGRVPAQAQASGGGGQVQGVEVLEEMRMMLERRRLSTRCVATAVLNGNYNHRNDNKNGENGSSSSNEKSSINNSNINSINNNNDSIQYDNNTSTNGSNNSNDNSSSSGSSWIINIRNNSDFLNNASAGGHANPSPLLQSTAPQRSSTCSITYKDGTLAASPPATLVAHQPPTEDVAKTRSVPKAATDLPALGAASSHLRFKSHTAGGGLASQQPFSGSVSREVMATAEGVSPRGAEGGSVATCSSSSGTSRSGRSSSRSLQVSPGAVMGDSGCQPPVQEALSVVAAWEEKGTERSRRSVAAANDGEWSCTVAVAKVQAADVGACEPEGAVWSRGANGTEGCLFGSRAREAAAAAAAGVVAQPALMQALCTAGSARSLTASRTAITTADADAATTSATVTPAAAAAATQGSARLRLPKWVRVFGFCQSQTRSGPLPAPAVPLDGNRATWPQGGVGAARRGSRAVCSAAAAAAGTRHEHKRRSADGCCRGGAAVTVRAAIVAGGPVVTHTRPLLLPLPNCGRDAISPAIEWEGEEVGGGGLQFSPRRFAARCHGSGSDGLVAVGCDGMEGGSLFSLPLESVLSRDLISGVQPEVGHCGDGAIVDWLLAEPPPWAEAPPTALGVPPFQGLATAMPKPLAEQQQLLSEAPTQALAESPSQPLGPQQALAVSLPQPLPEPPPQALGDAPPLASVKAPRQPLLTRPPQPLAPPLQEQFAEAPPPQALAELPTQPQALREASPPELQHPLAQAPLQVLTESPSQPLASAVSQPEPLGEAPPQVSAQPPPKLLAEGPLRQQLAGAPSLVPPLQQQLAKARLPALAGAPLKELTGSSPQPLAAAPQLQSAEPLPQKLAGPQPLAEPPSQALAEPSPQPLAELSPRTPAHAVIPVKMASCGNPSESLCMVQRPLGSSTTSGAVTAVVEEKLEDRKEESEVRTWGGSGAPTCYRRDGGAGAIAGVNLIAGSIRRQQKQLPRRSLAGRPSLWQEEGVRALTPSPTPGAKHQLGRSPAASAASLSPSSPSSGSPSYRRGMLVPVPAHTAEGPPRRLPPRSSLGRLPGEGWPERSPGHDLAARDVSRNSAPTVEAVAGGCQSHGRGDGRGKLQRLYDTVGHHSSSRSGGGAGGRTAGSGGGKRLGASGGAGDGVRMSGSIGGRMGGSTSGGGGGAMYDAVAAGSSSGSNSRQCSFASRSLRVRAFKQGVA